MLHCTNCGVALPERARYCTACGKEQAPIGDSSTPPQGTGLAARFDALHDHVAGLLRLYWQRFLRLPAAVRWPAFIGGFLLIVALLGAMNAVLEGAADAGKQGERAKAVEKAAPDEVKAPPKEATVKRPRPAPVPEPHEPEERILWRLTKTHHDVNLVSNPDPIVLRTSPSGCKTATINYETIFVGSNLDLDPPIHYRAVYKDPELRGQVCLVRTNGFHEESDDFGNKRMVRLITTSMDRRTAAKINWKNEGSVNFARLFEIEYLAPSARADIAQQNARRAVDCAEDQGLFDLDELDC